MNTERNPPDEQSPNENNSIHGEFIAAESSADQAASANPFANYRVQTSSIFAAAEARLRAAHSVVAQHVDQRITTRFDARMAQLQATDPDAALDSVASEKMKQELRDDFAARQRRLTERLAEGMQNMALDDVGAVTDMMDKAGQAAADALRPPKVINPTTSR